MTAFSFSTDSVVNSYNTHATHGIPCPKPEKRYHTFEDNFPQSGTSTLADKRLMSPNSAKNPATVVKPISLISSNALFSRI